MIRRSLLIGVGVSLLSACASKKPKVPLKHNDLRTFGMLPIKEWVETGSTAQFDPLSNPVPATMAGAPPPINTSMLGMAIGQSIRAGRDAARAALASAMTFVGFDPGTALLSAIQRELERRAAPMEPLKSGALAARVRDNVLSDLPTDIDAILDVQIRSAGYYPLSKGLGFSPYAHLTARLLDTVNPGFTIEEFAYEADSGASDGDIRYIQFPAELTQPSLTTFAANATTIRAAFEDAFNRIGSKVVDDTLRVRDKLPRLG